MIWRFSRSAAALAVGCLLIAGFYWALLNVPESNVLALSLSALLVLLTVAAGGVTTGAALALAQAASFREAIRRAAASLPGFAAGLVVFGVIWWATGTADAWWRANRGEIDALFIRYAGLERTGWLHQAVSWLLFLLRWALGSSVVIAFTAEGGSGGRLAVGRSFRSIRLVALAAACAGVIAVTQVVWRVAFWRPSGLPPTEVELVFVATKLALLYALAIAVATAVLWAHVRRGLPDL